MTRFVLDPHALIDLANDGRPVSSAHQVVAPNAIRSQALELLLTAVRDGTLSEREALERHERMTAVKMRLLGDRVSRRVAFDLAREHGWADLRAAEYLAVTRLQADALVASGEELARLAEGIVPLAPLTALWT